LSGLLALAWRYLTHYRGRNLLLFACVALTALLPLTVEALVRDAGRTLRARAAATPLVVGARGSRFDVVLASLYFRGRVPRSTSMAELERLLDDDLGLPIPLLARRTAQERTVVGTTPEYYEFRSLRAARGTIPLFVGEAALGADVASALALDVGATLLTDRGSVYDLASGYPLRLRVCGVLAHTGTPDDGAVFVDLKTAWVLEGIGHGHADAETLDAGARLPSRGTSDVVLNASVTEAVELVPERAGELHFHGAPEDFPLTGVLVVPATPKQSTLLKGRYRVRDDAELFVPADVVEEVLGLVFRLKRFFDANVIAVATATVLLLGLILWLTLRLRRRELLTLARIGVSRGSIAALVALEFGLVIGAALGVAFLSALPTASLLQRTLLGG